MRETEIKSIIDEKTYLKAEKAFKWDSIREQENHYYTDDNGVLRERRVMVRVRVVEGISKIQVKLHKNKNSPLQICEETEFDIDEVPEIIDKETAKKITGMDVGLLRRMGCSVTLRHSMEHNGSELCLDKTTYFGKTDYEVEVEYEEKMSADILMKLTSLGILFNKKCIGKFSRFLDEYLKQ
ncbi:MAG: CYTH domain-containing protein [Oscillospiraceae bacterium]|nr:CYTH domain-containing protein [Oscillospiraceae bacterium]